ncbi:SRPBCC family protein [Shewanella khirikhana]|uniref:Activator of Hsp90 ATPase homologue 1/2-like C-terminal domain-containing protein n=1 Tax=Shewanella khirikhana TaxID=1965282 RepID=A0ABN5TRR3_9GAMM|nr:SRPBCC family protein [Shewanella khirikhana]AZQ10183.1 hypothetical protein STH12_01047 [Shewanella khirikhana]
MKITVETHIQAPLTRVWQAWITPADIVQWNFAHESWCCPAARLDLHPEGQFSYRMEARDGSGGFDFNGRFTEVMPCESLRFVIEDGREVSVCFKETDSGVLVSETFETEDEHSAEMQRQGWQAILDNFKRHVEANGMSSQEPEWKP